jgi:hypothetical protein
MSISVEHQIRDQLIRYLSGEISLQALSDWLVPYVLTLDQKTDPAAADLAFEIELRLAEYSNGDWTQDELRDILRPLVASPATPGSQ